MAASLSSQTARRGRRAHGETGDGVMLIGRHVSGEGSLTNAIKAGDSLGCTAIQIFTKSPRAWKARDIPDSEIRQFINARKESGIKRVVSHISYLPNFASPKADVYKISKAALVDELKRCELLEIDYLVLHLGSHLGEGAAAGRRRVADAVLDALEYSSRTRILLENEAGQKNSVGSELDELKEIHDMVGDRVGFCIDTCHAFAAGYDIRKEGAAREIVKELGSRNIDIVHVNDAKGGLGSHLDRHENIGFGLIGEHGFKEFFKANVLKDKTLILETPSSMSISEEEEINLVRRLAS